MLTGGGERHKWIVFGEASGTYSPSLSRYLTKQRCIVVLLCCVSRVQSVPSWPHSPLEFERWHSSSSWCPSASASPWFPMVPHASTTKIPPYQAPHPWVPERGQANGLRGANGGHVSCELQLHGFHWCLKAPWQALNMGPPKMGKGMYLVCWPSTNAMLLQSDCNAYCQLRWVWWENVHALAIFSQHILNRLIGGFRHPRPPTLVFSNRCTAFRVFTTDLNG